MLVFPSRTACFSNISLSSHLERELLCDLWQVRDSGLGFVQRHHYEVFKEFPLLQLHQIPLQGPVASRLPQHGLDRHQPLAVSWEIQTAQLRQTHPRCVWPHKYACEWRVTEGWKPICSSISVYVVFMFCYTEEQRKEIKLWSLSAFARMLPLCLSITNGDTQIEGVDCRL